MQLVELLQQPNRARDLPLRFWNSAMPVMRRGGTLGRIAAERRALGERGLPTKIEDQFTAALLVADRQVVSIATELRILGDLLPQVTSTPILLKGAAYQALGLPNSRGRLASDVDLLVPKSDLAAVEALLLGKGWAHVNTDEYDQRYYRTWMHEIPPLVHLERATFLDVHHTITPPTSKYAVDADRLFESALRVGDGPFHVLAPADMVLHSVCHLMSESVFLHRLRDLNDIRELIDHFRRAESAFPLSLAERAVQLGVARPLHHVLRCLERSFGMDLPSDVPRILSGSTPTPPVDAAMAWLIDRTIVRGEPKEFADWIATSAMIARSHYLRMPLILLLPHLARKSWRRLMAGLVAPAAEAGADAPMRQGVAGEP